MIKYIFSIVALFVCANFALAKEFNMPFDGKESTSPDGNYVIACEEIASPIDGKVDDDWIKLLLKNKTTGKSQEIIGSVNGYVYVKWAPDSKHFAVIYREGSDYLHSTIYNSDHIDKGIDPISILENKKFIKIPKVAYHRYSEVTKWVDSKSYIINVSFDEASDHGELKWFDYYFYISLDLSVKKLSENEVK